MGTLQVYLAAGLGDEVSPWNVVVPLELIDEAFQVATRTFIFPFNQHALQVDAGWYLVRATLPSGERLAQAVHIPDSDNTPVEVWLNSTPSQHEWLGWPHFLGSDIITLNAAIESSSVKPAFPLARLWHTENRSAMLFSGQINADPIFMPPVFWIPDQEILVPIDQACKTYGKIIGSTDDIFSMVLDFSRLNTLFMLQIVSAGPSSHFIALPPTPGKVQITISLMPQEAVETNAFAIQITSLSAESEIVLHNLRKGAFKDVSLIEDYFLGRLLEHQLSEQSQQLRQTIPSEDFSEQPQELEQPVPSGDFIEDKIYAVASGYYLLRMGNLKLFDSWVDRYADLWMPDILVIDAWQMLLRGVAPSNLERARKRLLWAVRRGPPLYTQGLRLLLNGLELFSRRVVVQSDQDREVEEALEIVRNYATTVDWYHQLTTFRGDEPMKPTILNTPGTHL